MHRSPSNTFRGPPDPSSGHKSMRQKLERVEGALLALPQALEEYLEAFSSCCLSGLKLASLFETLFHDTPVLLVALRFREACEQVGDKAAKSGLLLRQEVVGPVKRAAPVFGVVRGRLESHAKAANKHEGYLRQLESLKSAQGAGASRHKVAQMEGKFHSSAEDFAREDSLLAEALSELQRMRVEVSGVWGGGGGEGGGGEDEDGEAPSDTYCPN